MRRLPISAATLLLAACAAGPERHTIAELQTVEADLEEVYVGDSLGRALEGYQRFLKETPANAKTPEAMRRMADLQIEQRYGILGAGPAAAATEPDRAHEAGQTPEAARRDALSSAELPMPARIASPISDVPAATDAAAGGNAYQAEDQADFEARASAVSLAFTRDTAPTAEDPVPRQAIETYQRILENYPYYERKDQVLYQMARAYDELGEPERAMEVMDRFIAESRGSEFADEVYFRRAEYFFVRRQYLDAEESYQAVIGIGEHSEFYELALYKLGWSFYKQDLYEEALHRYMALLDYKVARGYDFGNVPLAAEPSAAAGPPPENPPDAGASQKAAEYAANDDAVAEEEERRVADTFRVISLAFSNLGGPEILNEYFEENGSRGYENRIYSNLGEFYLDKLRYHDAATVYRSFADKHPFHRVSPLFSMRVVEIYGEGGFAKLVVDAKQDFATRYALDADYWLYFDVAQSPEVMGFLKTNLADLAGHYHSLYQDESLAEQQPAHYGQALRWYREYLESFPEDEETPGLHYQLADLLFEHEDFRGAALAYENTAYEYPLHERSAAAGYAAIVSHRQNLEIVDANAAEAARLATVDSSLRFADTFVDHEHAATVLGAAADDLYDMSDYPRAIAAGHQLIDTYPGADEALLRSAWVVVGHASMDLEVFPDAEHAYGQVLSLTPEDDETRSALYDNLAVSIYKQGETARAQEDHALAAEHFLRVREAAPSSSVRPAAEYDAATALMKLEDWERAGTVFREFREAHPEHELQRDVTKQLAYVYREAGNLSSSAAEYVRVADETEDPELRRESLLMAGDLYDDAGQPGQALDVFTRYVEAYPSPVDLALEIRYRMAGMHESAGSRQDYHDALRRIVEIDAAAGAQRNPRTRYLAGKSALVLARIEYRHFDELALTQPFEASLAEKNARMETALAAFERLVEYQVPEVTTAATFYMAEIYSSFGTALLQSERPADLDTSERVEYDMVLEGEAFPFEERAIEVHEKNLELMLASGTFDDWVAQSLARLAVLMPGRYAKHEISSGYIGPVEVFAYRSPAAEREPEDTAAVSAPGSMRETVPDGGSIEVGATDTEGGATDVPAVL